jgi:hypothetical protein
MYMLSPEAPRTGKGHSVAHSSFYNEATCQFSSTRSLKKYSKAKEELWKLIYFTIQKYNLPKDPLKETKILQDIITL